MQLLEVNLARCVQHQVGLLLRLRKRYHVPDRASLAQKHEDAVNAKSQATMRWRPILKRIHKKAELSLGLFFVDSESPEHISLKLAVVDTNGAAANLDTIENAIVCLRFYRSRISQEPVTVLWQW